MVDIKEHDPKDLEQGILRLGRETKSEPVDITDRYEDLEFVPVWKQTGKRPDPDNEHRIWLWDNRLITKYDLNVWPTYEGHYYVCLDSRRIGALYQDEEGLWNIMYEYFAAFHWQYKSESKEEALRACLQIHSEGHEYR